MTDRIKLAIVDDHYVVGDTISSFMQGYGFNVLMVARNGQEFLDFLERSDVLPDVCLLDINMPVLDGYDTAKVLRQKYPSLKIIAFSANLSMNCVADMLHCGATSYLTKDVAPKELQEAILQIHNTGYYFPEMMKTQILRYFQTMYQPFTRKKQQNS